jgi:6-pyruvoyltetrahydropterin/6-carboxytetrahydropterin synthase
MGMEISTTRVFSASHQLKLYNREWEPLHGHNWQVRVTVSAKKLDKMGVVMDFHDLERRVDAILNPLHNSHLNDSKAFSRRNPSAENVALHIVESLTLPKGITLICVDVWETETNRATWRA